MLILSVRIKHLHYPYFAIKVCRQVNKKQLMLVLPSSEDQSAKCKKKNSLFLFFSLRKLLHASHFVIRCPALKTNRFLTLEMSGLTSLKCYEELTGGWFCLFRANLAVTQCWNPNVWWRKLGFKTWTDSRSKVNIHHKNSQISTSVSKYNKLRTFVNKSTYLTFLK